MHAPRIAEPNPISLTQSRIEPRRLPTEPLPHLSSTQNIGALKARVFQYAFLVRALVEQIVATVVSNDDS